jgi:hypothetical protein
LLCAGAIAVAPAAPRAWASTARASSSFSPAQIGSFNTAASGAAWRLDRAAKSGAGRRRHQLERCRPRRRGQEIFLPMLERD